MSVAIQATRCPKIFAGCWYLQSCLLLYSSRTLLQYFAVTERHTEREVSYLLLLCGRHQRHRPAHKARNLTCAVWLILSVQYQQKLSADTVKSQRTAWCRPQSHLMCVSSCFTRFRALGLWSRGMIQYSASRFASCCISHLTTPLVP